MIRGIEPNSLHLRASCTSPTPLVSFLLVYGRNSLGVDSLPLIDQFLHEGESEGEGEEQGHGGKRGKRTL